LNEKAPDLSHEANIKSFTYTSPTILPNRMLYAANLCHEKRIGLLEHGYRDSPLEEMAYSHQSRFETGKIYDVEHAVHEEMQYYDNLLGKYNVFK
jgi:hypothetical protein